MNIREIQAMPQTTYELTLTKGKPFPDRHESVFRSYHILEKVKYLLNEGTSNAVVLELIEEMECDVKLESQTIT